MRFIHLADVHLGAVPDRGFPWSSHREDEIWGTLRRLVDKVRKDPVDLIFIAGDLFHRQPLQRELEEVSYIFDQIPETRIYLCAGNHDYLSDKSFYRSHTWPSNVYFFRSEEAQRVKDPRLPVYVYGLSYEHQEIKEPLYDEMEPWMEEGEEEDALHILLAHGGDETHIPLKPMELARAGFDYVALGHIHKPAMLVRDRVCYSGALEPIDRGDEGEHGYILGWTEEGRLRTRFVKFACRSYCHIQVDVSPQDTRFSVEDRVKEAILSMGASNIYKITLKGQCSLEQLFFFDRLRKLGNILEVADETRPSYDVEELYLHYRGTLIGDYILTFFPEVGGEISPSLDVGGLSPAEEKALYYGLMAMIETAQEG